MPHQNRTLFPAALALLLGWLLLAPPASAEPRTLFARPVPCPSRERSANVQWDDAGFMGRISIEIFDTTGTLLHEVELPEIDPSPTDLIWLDNEWVAAQSTLGTRGTALFYVHAPTGRGCLLEAMPGRSSSGWDFSFLVHDSVCSASVPNASLDRTCLFPLQLRDLPTEPSGYFRPPFPARLTAAGDAFREFRRQAGFRDLEILTEPEVRADLGALLLARFDDEPRLVYFPTGTTTPAEMFSRLRHEPLNEATLQALECPDDISLTVRWEEGEGGRYVIEGVFDGPGLSPTTTPLMRGSFPDAWDTPPPSPEALLLLADAATTTPIEAVQDESEGPAPSPPDLTPSRAKTKARSALVSAARTKVKAAVSKAKASAKASSRRRR